MTEAAVVMSDEQSETESTSSELRQRFGMLCHDNMGITKTQKID